MTSGRFFFFQSLKRQRLDILCISTYLDPENLEQLSFSFARQSQSAFPNKKSKIKNQKIPETESITRWEAMATGSDQLSFSNVWPLPISEPN